LSPFASFPTGELDRLFGDLFAFVFPAGGASSGIESGVAPIGSETTPLGAELTINVAFVDPGTVGVSESGRETLVVDVLGPLTAVLVVVSGTTGPKVSLDAGTD
jgi:hypothetical protein